MSDFARSVQILVEIAGNPEAKLDEINKKLDTLSNKKVEVSGGSQVSSHMENLSNSTNKASNSITSFASNLTGKATSALGTLKSSLSDVQGSIQNMASALAGMTIGGAVSGLAWKQSSEYKLIDEQIERAIANNKKLGFSYQELQDFSKQQAIAGEGTRQDTTKELYATVMAGQKYMKGDTGQEKLQKADAITDFWFSQQELMKQEGINSPESLIRRVTRQPGKMGELFGASLQTAMGASEKDMASAKTRMALMIKAGSEVKMTQSDLTPEDRKKGIVPEMDKRPWEQLEVNISRLKNAIGDSIAVPMMKATNILAGFVELLVKIPFIPTLIGLAGAALALVSALSLVSTVLGPGIALFVKLNNYLKLTAGLKWLLTGATTAQATSEEILAIQMGAENAMRETQIVTENTSFASRLRLVGVTAKDTLVKYANTAANYLHLSSIVSIIGMENISFGSKIKLIGAKVWSTLATSAETAANFLGITSLLGLTAASGVATGGFTLLGIATNFAAAPLWLIIGAGLVLVGVLAAIAYKAGILSPLLKGISNIDFGKTFGKVFSLDFKGAWGDIKKGFSDIKFPSLAEALTNVFGGNSLISIMNRVFGIPLFTIANWITKIHDLLKPLLNIISDLWSLINHGLNWIRDGLGITKQQKEAKVKTIAEEEGVYQTKSGAWGKIQKGMQNERPTEDSQTFQSFTPIEGSRLATAIENANKAPKGFFEGIPGINDLTKAINDLIAQLSVKAITAKATTTLTNSVSSNSGLFDTSSMTEKERNKETFWEASIREGKTLLGLPSAASGGFVQKSGLAIVHENEPIIPAEIASSSRLQEILGSIATGKSNPNIQPNIQISMTYSAPASNTGIYLDKFSFERAVKEIIGKVTRTYGAY